MAHRTDHGRPADNGTLDTRSKAPVARQRSSMWENKTYTSAMLQNIAELDSLSMARDNVATLATVKYVDCEIDHSNRTVNHWSRALSLGMLMDTWRRGEWKWEPGLLSVEPVVTDAMPALCTSKRIE